MVFNTALIGHGYWGKKLEGYIRGNPDFNLVSICNSKSNLEEVWGNTDITAVVIAVRNEQRYDIVRSALKHGKNVLAEKPLAMSFTDATNLKQISLMNNVQLAVDFTWTFSRSLLKACDLVEQGIIGDLLGMELSIKHLGRFGGGSVYWLLGSHVLSILSMFRPLSELDFSREDLVVHDGQAETGVISFQDSSEFRGQAVVSLNYLGKDDKVVLYGRNGTIIFNPLALNTLTVESYERQTWVLGKDLPCKKMVFSYDEGNNLKGAIEYFSKVLQGRTESNVEVALEITRVLEGLHEA